TFLLCGPAPPSATLVPYTTLFRSDGGRQGAGGVRVAVFVDVLHGLALGASSQPSTWSSSRIRRKTSSASSGSIWLMAMPAWTMRSEEHTSELQSLRHLVCRLLLEK